MKKLFLISAVFLFVFNLSAQRNDKWAVPIQANNITNFYQVDKDVYRCGQPNAEGFIELEKMGIREVLNLRNYHNDNELARNTKLRLHRIRMNAGDSNWDKLVIALRIIKNRSGPIVIHCWHGSDRTGMVCALYRLVFQNWTKEEAINELVNGGYGYHEIYRNILTFIQEADIEKMRREIFSE